MPADGSGRRRLSSLQRFWDSIATIALIYRGDGGSRRCIGVSALATEKSYYLFFMIAATYFLCEFHRTSKLSAASLAGGALGLGMLCKYLTALVIPAFGIAFLLAGTWRRLQVRAVLALGLTLLAVMTPDLWWNVAHRDTSGSAAANVGDHLQRVGGLGISPYPLLFYLLDVSHSQATREEATAQGRRAEARFGLGIVDPVPEYPAMNALMGVGVLGGMGWITASSVFRRRTAGRRARAVQPPSFIVPLLHMWFWFVLIFFMSIRPGAPKVNMDPVVWFWVDSTLLPAVLLVGRGVIGLGGWQRYGAAMLFGAGAVYGVVRML